jgi:hypothetical protein
MSSVDPWQKADEFQKTLKWIADPKLKAAFTEFRDLWIALANKKSSSHQLIWKLRLKLSIAFTANGFPRVVGRCLLIGPPQEMDPMGDNSIGYSLALASYGRKLVTA